VAKKAFVSLTGGLNNVDRPDTLEEDQLQECVNYEITGVGKLEKRTDPSQYSSNLDYLINNHFTEVIFVSEPYYPPNRLDGIGIDKHMLFIYGIDNNEYTMKVAVLSSGTTYTIEDSLKDLYDNGLSYISESVIDISVGERGVYISDGVNPIHKVFVDSRGTIVASWVGLKAPTNKPRISIEPLNKQFDNTGSEIEYEEGDSSGLGGIGLIRCQYTVVSDTGQESNPSPASDFTNAQYFKIAADGVTDERLIKSITVQDLNIPSVPVAIEDSLSYFKIYYQIIRYSEGTLLDTMEFSTQVDIINKTTDTISTKNEYIITNIKTSGETISFENDTGFPCKVSATNAGVLMVGGLKKSANIPGEFEYMTPITVKNNNTISAVDAIVKIRITPYDTKDKDNIIAFNGWENYFEKQGFTDDSGEYINGLKWRSDSYSKHLRIYDNDMTSPIMVYVKDQWSGTGYYQKLDIYVKIPLLTAGSSHTLYFCWNDISSGSSDYSGISNTYNDIDDGEYDWGGNIGVHYGRWVLSTDNIKVSQTRQQVFQERRVATAGTEILAIPHMASLGLPDDGREGYDLVNIANTSCHGEATTEQDPHIVQNTCLPPVSSNMKAPTETKGDWSSAADYSKSTGSYWMVQHRFYDYEEKQENTIGGYQTIAYSLTELLGWNKHRRIFLPLYRLRSEKVEDENIVGDGDSDITLAELTSVESKFTQPGNSAIEVTTSGAQYSGYCTGTLSTLGYTHITQSICLNDENYSNAIWTDWQELHDDWNKNRGLGYIRGLAPITSLGSHGENLANYLITNSEIEYTALPEYLNRMNLNRAFNRISPFITTGNVFDKFSNSPADPNDHYSIGAFKPFCGGWSFKKSAENIGNIPDKGYFYTHLGFRLGDLQDCGGGTGDAATLKPSGTSEKEFVQDNVENQKYWYQNTIFYVACGSINDVDAEPNHPLKFDPYPDSETWETAKQLTHSQAVQYIDARYNADNFRPTSETGADPGDIVISETGDGNNANTPENGNVATHGSAGARADGDITEDTNVITNTDPLQNLFFVHIRKYYPYVLSNEDIDYSQPRYRLRLFVRTADGYDAHLNIHIFELNDEDGVDVFQNLFVYVSWDLVNERFALGYRYLDPDTNKYTALRMEERDYSSPTTEMKIRDGLRNKPLYDIGLGNSTYLNRIVSASTLHKTFNMSGYHGFYGTTEMTSGTYKGITDNDKHFIYCLSENMPRFENPVGDNLYDNTYNNGITFKDTIQRTNKVYDNMVMWSEVNQDSLPDLNYKLLKEPVVKILSAPSFLKFEYSNTFLIFTRNTINRFVLKGTASGWSGSSESLIEEQVQYGLYAPDSLTKVGGDIFWLSEEGVVRWSPEGLLNISGNVITIPLVATMKGFYCSVNNQYMLHDNTENITYVYDLTYRRWTTFKGLDITSSSLLMGGTNVENINLFLKSNGKIDKYPTGDKTNEDAHIKTKDMMMESASINRIKLDYNGDSSADLTYTIRNVKSDGTDVDRTKKITGIEKNVWRGTGTAGRKYGREANIKIENADEIYKILYDLSVRGGE
jgi:hypothetical protein